jgi:hypothetical protein
MGKMSEVEREGDSQLVAKFLCGSFEQTLAEPIKGQTVPSLGLPAHTCII